MTTSMGFGIFGGLICLYGIWRWRRTVQMRQWIQISATISKIEIEVKKQTNLSGSRLDYYEPRVQFRYRVGDTDYSGSRFNLNNFTVGNRKGEIDDLLHGAKEGDSIEVYYNPKDPRQAIINLPGNQETILILVAGFFIVMFALLGGLSS